MYKVIVIFTFIFFSSNLIALEKVSVPDYVKKETKSPWNFYENFEDGKLNFEYVKKSKNISNSPGKKPYKFKKDPNGNTFLSVTVKNEWNKCCGKNFYSERAEIFTKKKNAKDKEIWYGFRIRFPENFKFVNDRLMFSQFMNEFKNMKKGPLMGMRLYWSGGKLSIGGDTGGKANASWNSHDNIKYRVLNHFVKKSDTKNWQTYSIKRRDQEEVFIYNCDAASNENSTEVPNCKKFNKIDFNSTPLGKWTTYKIGIKNSKTEDGFIKVYKDDTLIMNYSGITFGGWKGTYKHTYIKLGPYRDTDINGKGYPDQTIHYDDFVIVSDKKTLDKYLSK